MAVILDDEVRFSLKSEQKKSDDNQVGYEGSVKPSILQHKNRSQFIDIFYKKQQSQAAEYLTLFENENWQICNELAEVNRRIGIFNWLKYQCKVKYRTQMSLGISMNSNKQFVCQLKFKQGSNKNTDSNNKIIEDEAALILDIKRELKFVFKFDNLVVTRLPQSTFDDQKNRYFDFLFGHYRLLLGCTIIEAVTDIETKWNQAVEVCIVNLVSKATNRLAGTDGFSQFPSIIEIESRFAESIIAKALEFVFR